MESANRYLQEWLSQSDPQTRAALGEILLGTARNYMLDVVNVSGGNVVVSVVFEWYEESV